MRVISRFTGLPRFVIKMSTNLLFGKLHVHTTSEVLVMPLDFRHRVLRSLHNTFIPLQQYSSLPFSVTIVQEPSKIAE
jgi:hypothetical protein